MYAVTIPEKGFLLSPKMSDVVAAVKEGGVGTLITQANWSTAWGFGTIEVRKDALIPTRFPGSDKLGFNGRIPDDAKKLIDLIQEELWEGVC